MTREEYFKKNREAIAAMKKALSVPKKVKTVPKKVKTLSKKVKTVSKKVKTVHKNIIPVSYTEEYKKNYLKKWRANNKAKVAAYKLKAKTDPLAVARTKAYEKARAKDPKRLERNRLKHQENMENPIYARKEWLRGQLRRIQLDPYLRTKYEQEHKLLKQKWSERNKDGTN